MEQFGLEPNDLWIRAVADLQDAQIKNALERLVKEGGDHPPTLPKFVELARKAAPRPPDFKIPKVDAWQRMANAVFSARLRRSLHDHAVMVPAERGHEMLDGLRQIKAAYGRQYGADPTTVEPHVIEQFTAEVEALLDRLSGHA